MFHFHGFLGVSELGNAADSLLSLRHEHTHHLLPRRRHAWHPGCQLEEHQRCLRRVLVGCSTSGATSPRSCSRHSTYGARLTRSLTSRALRSTSMGIASTNAGGARQAHRASHAHAPVQPRSSPRLRRRSTHSTPWVSAAGRNREAYERAFLPWLGRRAQGLRQTGPCEIVGFC